MGEFLARSILAFAACAHLRIAAALAL